MTQEDKQLLLKDICARLPYKVKGVYARTDIKNLSICEITTHLYGEMEESFNGKEKYEFIPYLFPLSSMTEEMLEELNTCGFFKYRDTIANVSHLENNGEISKEIYTYIDIESISVLIEFFHSHHIDYRGFIEKGLAIDATGLNIY